MNQRAVIKNKIPRRVIALGILGAVILGALILPSLYAHHCKTRVYDDMAVTVTSESSVLDSMIRIAEIEEKEGEMAVHVGTSGVIFAHEKDTYYAITSNHAVEEEEATYVVHTIHTPSYKEVLDGTAKLEGLETDSSAASEAGASATDESTASAEASGAGEGDAAEANASDDASAEDGAAGTGISLSDYYAALPAMEVVYRDEALDLAIVSFSYSDVDLPTVKIAQEAPPRGEKVVCIGTSGRAGEDALHMTFGKVRSRNAEVKVSEDGETEETVFRHTAYSVPGNRGGAVFNRAMQLVGINLGGNRKLLGRFSSSEALTSDQIQSLVNQWLIARRGESEYEEDDRPDQISFVDAFGEKYEVAVNRQVPKNPYLPERFVDENGLKKYEDDTYTSQLGIDVSRHNGGVNWEEIRKAGIEFAFIRIGFRGYGQEGGIYLDERFEEYYKGATEAGLKVGVYFFSQAVTEEEAEEEAKFVLKQLNARKLDLPIVFDPENILHDTARTDDVTGEQFTANAIRFCEGIRAAGYEPAIYSNMLWEAYKFDLTKLAGYPIWYADYQPTPQTPYAFEYWQYTENGKIPGAGDTVNINIRLVKKSDVAE